MGKAYDGLFLDALEGDGEELGFADREGGGLLGCHGGVCESQFEVVEGGVEVE